MGSLAESKDYSKVYPQTSCGHDKGGRGPSVWDVALRDASTGNGDDAYSFELWRDDIKLLKQYGATSYRFSISWSRLIPLGGKEETVNEEGVQYYSDLIDALLEANITPFVTIFHWDLPLELEKRYGGFMAAGDDKELLLSDYENHAAVCFKHFGDRVKHWITHNEPMIFTMCTAVCLKPYAIDMNTTPWLMGHNLILTHARAVACYRRDFADQKGTIGITLNIEWSEPLDDSAEAKAAAQRSLDIQAWYAIPIYLGKHNEFVQKLAGDAYVDFTEDEWAIVRKSSDFFGVNHYSTKWATGQRPREPESL